MAAEDRRRSRPPLEDIRAAYDHLFHSDLSLSKIKDAALGGRLFSPPSGESIGVCGRSIAWKIFLTPPGPLQLPPDLPLTPQPYIESVRTSRQEYTRLLLDKMKAPDGSYEDGFVVPGTSKPPERTARSPNNLERNNPLSLHDENPWKEWFAAVELRKTILQDVERTFPDIPYFREPAVQSQLTNILFLYSVMHPVIGYRQGMHELLAPLFYAIDYDSISSFDINADTTSLPSELQELCSRDWVAADAWALLTTIMRGVGRWYEWRETPPNLVASSSSAAGGTNTALSGHVNLAVNGQVKMPEEYVAPILRECARIQGELLKRVDPTLWEKMREAGIEPQIYGIRWLRLVFTREFNMQDAMMLWDGLFAVDPSFELAPWICVAMLIRIRNQLIPADYSTQLTYLLRYPNPSNVPSTLESNRITLLLRQALTLQMSPSPATGAAIVFENKNLLGLPTEVPEPLAQPIRRGAGQVRRRASVSTSEAEAGVRRGPGAGMSGSGGLGGHSSPGHTRQSSSQVQIGGLPEMIAKGLLDRGEALGINKAFLHAVSEVKRNLPDLAASMNRSPSGQVAYPLLDERPPEERPSWEPRTRFEMERDVSEMQAKQRMLGESVSWIVDTLLLDEGKELPEDEQKTIKARKREALESLSYVRDVLLGSVKTVEPDRLISEEEVKIRKEKARLDREGLEKIRNGIPSRSSMDPPVISPPPPTRTAAPPSTTHGRPVASRRISPQADALISPRHEITNPHSPNLPSSNAGTPSANISRAPWNYTRSDFSAAASTLPVPSLAPLPRASTTTSRSTSQTSATSMSYPSPQPPPPLAHSAGQTSGREQAPLQKVNHDPLGVLR